jgi:hypothetical protein
LFIRKAPDDAGSAVTGALDKGSAILDSAGSGGASASAVVIRAFGASGGVVEEPFAGEVGAAESEAGVEAEAGGDPRPSAATADDPKKANNMAAMASLTSLPLT